MNKDFSIQLADAVKFHRKQVGLTQHELANYAGVGKTVIFDIEHAKPTVKMNTILKVLDVLNISLTLTSPMGHSSGGEDA